MAHRSCANTKQISILSWWSSRMVPVKKSIGLFSQYNLLLATGAFYSDQTSHHSKVEGLITTSLYYRYVTLDLPFHIAKANNKSKSAWWSIHSAPKSLPCIWFRKSRILTLGHPHKHRKNFSCSRTRFGLIHSFYMPNKTTIVPINSQVFVNYCKTYDDEL